MKFGVLLIAALFLGAFGAHFLMDDRGYVLINFRGYSSEMSVPVLVLLLIALYATVRLLARVLRTPRNIGEAAARFREKRSRENLTRGLLEVSEGKFAHGEKLLARNAHRSEQPMLNYLGAARAAQLQGAQQRRDTWLKLAFEQGPDAATAVLLTQAELQIEERQYEQALATLQRLDEEEPGHGQGLALQAHVLRKLGDWQGVRELLPRLARTGGMPEGRLNELTVRCQKELLIAAGKGGNPEAVRALWRGLNRKLQNDPDLFETYARALRDSGDHMQAEEAIRKALKSSWNDGLVLIYGELETPNAAAALKRVEVWLRTRGDDPVLLLTAARLAMHNELWGKARSYLESSLAMGPRVDAYHVYGRLLEHLGETDEAAEAFRSGLSLATGQRVSGLPALSAPDLPQSSTAAEEADKPAPDKNRG